MFRTLVNRSNAKLVANSVRLISQTGVANRNSLLTQTATPSITSVLPTQIRYFSYEDDNTNNSQRLKGSCKWFDTKKGFGFIVPEDGGQDIFVHQTSIYAPGFRSLAENEPVEFSIFEDGNGRRTAVDVTGPEGGYVKGASRPQPLEYRPYDGQRGDGRGEPSQY